MEAPANRPSEDRAHPNSSWARACLTALIATAAVALVVLAFTWPTKTSEVKDLPVSISGPEASVSQIENTLNEKSPGTITFVGADSREDAVQQIEERTTYGAIVLSEDGTAAPEILTSPAASPVAAQMLSQIAQQITAQLQDQASQAQTAQLQAVIDSGQDPAAVAQASAQLQSLQANRQVAEATTVTTTAVVELSSEDSQGTGLAMATSLPLVMGGMIGGMISLFLVTGAWQRLTAVTLYSVLVGLALTLILNTWFGCIGGSFGAIWLAFSVSSLATGALIVGLGTLFNERVGAALGAILTMLVGNPLSSASAPWQFLPGPWGEIGQHMIPGASSSLLRTLSYFPEASTAPQWGTLLIWSAAGILCLIGGWYIHEARASRDGQHALA